MSGSGAEVARLAVAGMLAGLLTACAPGQLAPGSGAGPAAPGPKPGRIGSTASAVMAPTVVDSGFGALPWAGVLSGGPIGTQEFYDHTAETATARGYGHATPFEPPGFPDAFPAYPAPGIGYSGPAR